MKNKTWKAFKVSEIFTTIKRGKRLKNADHISGKIPYVSSTANNNGVDDYIKATEGTRVFNNCISLANSGSVGKAFYEPFHYVASDHVTALKAENLSSDCYLFLSTSVERQRANFNFNREINDARIKIMQFMLPYDNSEILTDADEEKPDFSYMSEYASQKRSLMTDKYMKYIKDSILELGDPVDLTALNDKNWGEFPLSDLFIVLPGKRLETRNKIPGNRPFIGASDNSNGITGFVGNDNSSKDSNVLGVNYNGAPCIAFYHPYECLFTDDVKRLHLRNYPDGKYIMLFFISVFAKQRSKYGYGYKFNEQRMLRQKLMVPVTDNGTPDYFYMEQYVKNLMIHKYHQYLTFKENQAE